MSRLQVREKAIGRGILILILSFVFLIFFAIVSKVHAQEKKSTDNWKKNYSHFQNYDPYLNNVKPARFLVDQTKQKKPKDIDAVFFEYRVTNMKISVSF